jgi:plastocyanin
MSFRVGALGIFSGLLLSLAFFSVFLDSEDKASAAAAGEIIGTVKLDGAAPKPKPIDMGQEPSCAQIHASKPATTEGVVVGAGGGLANVVIYLSEGYAWSDAEPSQPVKLDQKGCAYLPHVVAVNLGQKLIITNSDQAYHNVHPVPRFKGGNPEWNKSQMAGAAAIEETYKAEEVAFAVKCNVHPWMKAYVAVVKGPHAVTSESGTFKLEGVPPGTYTLTAWQETYGTLTSKVTVVAGKSSPVDFTFKAK